MTGGVVSISYNSWHFTEPPLLTEDEFNQHKQFILSYPDESIAPDTAEQFKSSMKWSNRFVVGGVIGLIICLGVESTKSRGFLYDTCETVGGVLLLIGIFSFMSFIKSHQSYRGYCSIKNAYYERLKEIIIASENYEQFLIEFEAQFLSPHQIEHYEKE